ncbi:MAG: hypothetical protein ABR526_11905, partial [Chthoniobacterales bacterium]
HYPESDSAVVLLSPEEQSAFVRVAPGLFAPVKGAWGLQGSTHVTLSAADEATVREAVKTAWQRRAPKPGAKQKHSGRSKSTGPEKAPYPATKSLRD